ncbi:putative aldouronate transport system substrate-binding protein [Evansella caseinilytica]|uniref:Putative aldouronate transport system substrate-binding protein n=1 Tax=Evansella caseinilytica TaxID=1503961 RepID=A0A1H3IMA2_9BACI|nr:ABC transporter substrate-binding protein [Evansella caseinilytica]SDY28485.1 putative aldouronate transport system substrate-binding protein [Evansella caseinilytica]
MLKRVLVLFVSLLFLFVFAACSSDEDASSTNDGAEADDTTSEGTEIDTTPVTYTFFNAASPGKDIDTNTTRIGKILEEKTGVNFKLEHIVGDMNTKIGVMVASGDYPDVVIPDAAIDTMLDAGAFIPLNDLLEEHGPDLLEAYGDYLDQFTMDDGNIYYIPFGATVNEHIPNPNIDQGAFWIQRGILKEYGFPEIKTLDEYFDIIERYAEENPQIDGMNVIPFTGLTYDWRFFAFSNAPNHLAGYPNDGGVMIDMETHEASVYADSDYAKRYLKKLNELNEKGLLDRELFVANYDEYLAKLSSGRVLGFFDYGWQFGDARNALRDAGNPDREFMALPIVLDEDIKDQYLDPPAFTGNRGAGITVNAENPERIIQFWNELIKEENQKLVLWGFEGEHYSVDENGLFYRTQEQIELAENEDDREETGMKTFEWNWPRLNGTFSDGNAVEPRRQPEVALASYTDDDREYLEAYGVQTFAQLFSDPDERPWYPAWSANIEQGSDVQIFEQKSDEIVRRHYARIVLAEPGDFEKEWDDFVAEYRKLDVDAYEDFFTKVVQARVRGEW